MLSNRSLHVIQRYWEQHLGCNPGTLFADPVRAIPHGGELEGYQGVFALFRKGRVVISSPVEADGRASLSQAVRQRTMEWLFHGDFTPDSLADATGSLASAVIGPAFIGYCEKVEGPAHYARTLGPDDAALLESLRSGCDATEWEHGGNSLENACSGVFEGEQLVGLAGYEVWGGAIAHISVITHPDGREQGLGRSAVAHVAQRALNVGLLPQYRTLEGNGPSMRVAESLGFEKYATSMAMRFSG